ncbi:MAG: hypothetical protein QNI91_13905 [Arenicellales bacterium]|nr:hypothetical protein [Arenicellales bacterium]
MSDYVYRKFPLLTEAMQALRAKDATFREVCTDYEEICTWLAARDDGSADADPKEYVDAQEVKLDLEDEILKLLEEHNDLIS